MEIPQVHHMEELQVVDSVDLRDTRCGRIHSPPYL